MAVLFSDLSDIRYNSFTGEYTPKYITNEENRKNSIKAY